MPPTDTVLPLDLDLSYVELPRVQADEIGVRHYVVTRGFEVGVMDK